MRQPGTSLIIPILAAALGGGLITYALVETDAFDTFYRFTRANEAWQLDELILALIVAVFTGLGVLAVTQHRDLKRLRATNHQLRQAHATLLRLQHMDSPYSPAEEIPAGMSRNSAARR